LQNYDCENLNNGVAIHAAHGGIQWIGGRINDFAAGLLINAPVESVVLQGVTAVSGSNFVHRTSVAGTTNRVTVMGNTMFLGSGNGINWEGTPAGNPTSLPTLGLSIVGNLFNVSGQAFVNFSHTSSRVNSKANVRSNPAGLMPETAIVL
jgi:hypothetical protein